MAHQHAPPEHLMASFIVNLRRRGARYDREAEEATQYPRRFIFFGPRVLTVRRFLEIEAKMHHTLEKRWLREMGLRLNAERAIDKRSRLAAKTQLYIDGVWARAAAAADAGLFVVEFLLAERAAAQAHRASRASRQ